MNRLRQFSLLFSLLILFSSSAVAQGSRDKLTTTIGNQVSFTLSDGLMIWLNAVSSVSYPTIFSKGDSIHVNGEAYFEMSSKSKSFPLIRLGGGIAVKADSDSKFTVRSYADDDSITVTVISKKIKIVSNGKETNLKPGEEATMDHAGGNISVKKIDTEGALAWKNGYFAFNNAELHEIMRVLQRWYDVQVTYKEEVPVKHFSGMFKRSTSFEEVIKLIGLTGGINITIEGKMITVSK